MKLARTREAFSCAPESGQPGTDHYGHVFASSAGICAFVSPSIHQRRRIDMIG